MRKLIIILMTLMAYSTQTFADKVSFVASAPDVVQMGLSWLQLKKVRKEELL